MNIFKKIFIPANWQDKEITALENWTVRWRSVHEYTTTYFTGRIEVEVFTSEVDANEFAKALKQANKLLKNTTLNIKVEKTK